MALGIHSPFWHFEFYPREYKSPQALLDNFKSR